MIREHKIGIAIVAFYFVVQMLCLGSIGLTDDDDFYIPAGATYVEWWGRALTFQGDAWTQSAIDRAFDPNHEHPPFAKYVFGLCQTIFRPLGPVDGARAGTVLFSTLAAALLMYLALSHLGPRRGLIAGAGSVVSLLLLPRFFFHSHAATLDVPVSAMYLAAATLALRGERSKLAAILSGPVFGLALSTKLNAPFLLVAYVVFFVLARRGRARLEGANTSASGLLHLPPVPLAFASMLILGPLVFWASWPWLWFSFTQRLGAYIGFHLHHYGIYFLYFGRIFSKEPFAPWHAPFVMAATTTPLALSALALLGIRYAVVPIVVRLRFPDGPDDAARKEGDLLLTAILHAAVAIGAVAFSGGAKYGGEKLFSPFFPFWCLLAGYGAMRLYEQLSVSMPKRWVAPSVLGMAMVSSLALQLRFGEYALSEYNGLGGGLRGATSLGLERQYYDVAYRDLVAYLNEVAPNGLHIHFLPNNWEYVRTFNWYKKAGRLRNDIEVVNDEGRADWIVITHERRFARYGDDLERHRTKPVLKERVIDGTPLWSVLKAR
jgi:hypothetical protein